MISGTPSTCGGGHKTDGLAGLYSNDTTAAVAAALYHFVISSSCSSLFSLLSTARNHPRRRGRGPIMINQKLVKTRTIFFDRHRLWQHGGPSTRWLAKLSYYLLQRGNVYGRLIGWLAARPGCVTKRKDVEGLLSTIALARARASTNTGQVRPLSWLAAGRPSVSLEGQKKTKRTCQNRLVSPRCHVRVFFILRLVVRRRFVRDT